jgi:hypothetical protein
MSRDQKSQPSNEDLRRPKANVIDQRQQQIDPSGQQRLDPNARPDANRKQPGGHVHHGERTDEGSAS